MRDSCLSWRACSLVSSAIKYTKCINERCSAQIVAGSEICPYCRTRQRPQAAHGPICPQCGGSMVPENGCFTCHSCGASKCDL